MYQCNASHCRNRINLFKCENCKITSYCSKNCQKKDWIVHKYICYPLLQDRLKALCIVIKKYSLNHMYYISLSSTIQTVYIDGIRHRLSAFPILPGKHYIHVCVICEKPITSESYQLDLQYDILHHTTSYTYYRCIKCKDENKILCNKSFIDSTICDGFTHQQSLIVYILLSIKWIAYQEIPNDIIYIIIRLMICDHSAMYNKIL